MSNIKYVLFMMVCSFFIFFVDARSKIKAETPSSNKKANITIQVSSLKNLERAEQEVARLKSHDLVAFYVHESVKNKGMWYRIYVGLFENKEIARDFADKLLKDKIISFAWVKRIKKPPQDISSYKTPKPEPHEIEKKPELKPAKPLKQPATADAPKVVPPTKLKPVTTKAPPVVSQPATKPPPKAITPKKEPKPVKVVKKAPKKQKRIPGKKKDTGRFSIGLNAGGFMAGSVDDFVITRTGGGGTKTWVFNGRHPQAGLVLSYHITNSFSIDGSYEQAVTTGIDLTQFTIGPSVHFKPIGRFTPYLKGSWVRGSLEWSAAPGEFDSGSGWRVGFGTYTPYSTFEIGIEAIYQDIEYSYQIPSDATISATDTKIDYSGFGILGKIAFRF